MHAQEFYDKASKLDSLGKEEEAIGNYEKAFQNIDELSLEDQMGLLLGMGSTYRWIGKLKKSEETFDEALKRFPDGKEFNVFRALTYLDNGKSKASVAELLEILLAETSSDSILKYKRALQEQVDILRK